MVAKTKVSSKGRVFIPKSVRDARGWGAGTELIIEETSDGVVLKPKLVRGDAKHVTVDDLLGIAGCRGRTLSIEQMDVAVGKTSTFI